MKLPIETSVDDKPGYTIRIYQHSRNVFSVKYGGEHKLRLTSVQAAHEYGACVMHALSCAGKMKEGR